MPDARPTDVRITVTPAKPWWRSKTLWANAAIAVLAAAEAKFDVLQPLLPLDVYTAIAFALPLVNIALRTVTNKQLLFPPDSQVHGARTEVTQVVVSTPQEDPAAQRGDA